MDICSQKKECTGWCGFSPFNSANKRQTSFASCDVVPDLEDDIDIEINEDELKLILTGRAAPADSMSIKHHPRSV